MRILFCSQAAHMGGGVETWMEALTDALAGCGWDVVTALARGRFHDPERYAARHRVANPIAIDGTRGLREVRILELLRTFERVQPDVILPVHLADAITAAALWKTRGGRARLALCIHGQDDDRIDQVRALAPFVDLAVSVSRRVAERLVPIVGERARVRHIPTGVPAPLVPPVPRERIRHLAYVGRLDRDEKRVGDAIALLRALRGVDVVLHFAGEGPAEEWMREELREEIESGRAIFHGRLAREELYRTFYPRIDALVVFSRAETGQIVLWEAMTHGVVPVISDYIGRREENVVHDGVNGIVFPAGEPEAAARALRAVMDSDRVTALSRNAIAQLPAAYTLAGFRDAWCDALARCTAMPLRKGSARDLPPLISPGFLAKLGLGLETTARLRILAGRRFVHHEPGSEWPH
jgi:glycosyltransferase involved in cell wall biosynthesis